MTSRVPGIRAMSLEHLIAVNDEIIALLRAGVPLEQGLASIGHDLPGAVGRITARLGESLSRGETLDAALAAHGSSFPPVYLAVIRTGLRSGRLESALESTAAAARNLADLRRTITLALAYPLLVLWLAIGLIALFTFKLMPTLLEGHRDLTRSESELLVVLTRVGESAQYWAIPLLAFLPLAWLAWQYYSGRAFLAQSDWATRLLIWFPGVQGMLQCARASTFAEVTGLLVEQRVPWHEAIALAAGSTGDAQLVQRVRPLALAAEEGRPADGSLASGVDLPPLLGWLIGAGGRHQALAPALKHAAESYRRRALDRADLLRVALPVLLTTLIGGGATLTYALIVFWPWSLLLRNIR